MPHRGRPLHDWRQPVHITLRAVDGLPSLRTQQVFRAARCAFAVGSKREFRIVHFSVQSNHLHLLVEAGDVRALSRGLQGLAIRLAKAVNRMIGRHGRVWRERYHAHALRTPREVRNALVYVLMNGVKHGVTRRGIDACSSGPWFAGWRNLIRLRPSGPPPVVGPRTWLLTVGWRRWGAVSIDEAPAATRG